LPLFTEGVEGGFSEVREAPFLCRKPIPRRPLQKMRDRPSGDPPFPSMPVSNHTPTANQSPNWATKKSPIWGMRSCPPRRYTPEIVEPDALRTFPSRSGGPAFLLPAPRSWAVSKSTIIPTGRIMAHPGVGLRTGTAGQAKLRLYGVLGSWLRGSASGIMLVVERSSRQHLGRRKEHSELCAPKRAWR
jgi:hypothetical protein